MALGEPPACLALVVSRQRFKAYNSFVSETILPTKLYMPPQRPMLVPRPRLIELLEQNQSSKLTLVAAPAGFGKTTLVTSWLAEPDTGNERSPACWLSLDENDNHYQRFFTYFIAAAQTIYPEAASRLMASLQNSPPDDEAILPALLYEFAELDRPLLVVLDDYHVIGSEAIHDALGKLIDTMPPSVHLLITSREEPPLPLPRWRVRGQLTEIGAADLRFTEEEAVDFMRQTMGLALDEAAVATLEERTEGWVAGLQLAALSLRGEQDSARFIAEFGGSDRHVTDYLLEEVLYRQPQDVQDFLLQTSILERFCAGLCDAVLAADTRSAGETATTNHAIIANGGSQAILEQLEAGNLFLIPLDGQRRWYRYHHLFAELLNDRLARAFGISDIDQLHRRASGWFAANGLMEEAIDHAVQGRDFDAAARMVASFPSDALWDQGYAGLIKRWGRLIPIESLQRHPRSLISVSAAYLITGEVQSFYKYLDLCEGIESIYGEYALLKCTLVRNDGDFGQALHLAQEAGEFLPQDEPTLRAMALMQIVNNLWRLGDLGRAERAVVQARAIVDQSTTISPNIHLQVMQMQGLVSLFQADYYQAHRQFREALTFAEGIPGATPPMVGMIHAELCRVHYEWNELAGAAHHLAQARSWAERTGISDIRIAAIVGEAQLACQRLSEEAARPYLEQMRQLALDSRLQDVHLQSESLIALYNLRLGRLDESIRWANASGLELSDRPDFTQQLYYVVLATVRLAEYRALGMKDGLSDISDLLHHLYRQAAAGHYQHDMIEILILQALVLDYGGDGSAARQALQQALDLAQPGSLMRTFLDAGPELAPILAQMDGPYALRLYQALMREPRAQKDETRAAELLNLTPREEQILSEIVGGLSNKEIEDKLVISRNTVRTHIKNLYSKLGVTSRTQAIRRARELDLF